MDMIDPKEIKSGDEVFVLYRNPHTPTVMNIKQAEIVPHPHNPEQNALFLHETYHLIEENDALFTTEEAAQAAYEEIYGDYPSDEYM
ncbi:transcriptional regulator SplA domain-containing protein [Pontibacillus salipaludis]|uniref:Transcriptional regulator SplA n=1 Tax=Pontibacillus salipaludis TaxID=1697394 RepID=A0ABQ1PL11_9BACI|nr:transcriptional regulator SplA domain-containing protein [Pontibacillus salipaludis]GGC98858.1 transcriptional regulator SplA [Pontibacillus salipaludis]